MKRFVMATAIVCALSVTTLAGDIPSDGAPQPQSQSTSPTLLGEMPSGDKAQSFSTAAISALLTALGLASIEKNEIGDGLKEKFFAACSLRLSHSP